MPGDTGAADTGPDVARADNAVSDVSGEVGTTDIATSDAAIDSAADDTGPTAGGEAPVLPGSGDEPDDEDAEPHTIGRD